MTKSGLLLVLLCCAAMTSSRAQITPDTNGNLYVEGEASDFFNWASSNFTVSVEGGQTMMQTIFDTAKGYHYATSSTKDALG